MADPTPGSESRRLSRRLRGRCAGLARARGPSPARSIHRPSFGRTVRRTSRPCCNAGPAKTTPR